MTGAVGPPGSTAAHRLSSTSRLGRASQIVCAGAALAALGFGITAIRGGSWVEAIPAGILAVIALVFWCTRVRTTVTDTDLRFLQLGRTIVVPIGQVHGCLAHVDTLGLGGGLRWLGRGQWAMLSGDDYLDISYWDGRSLLVSHRDAQGLAAHIMGHLS